MPPGSWLVGVADDVALIVTAGTEEALRSRIKWAVQRVLQWLKQHALEQAVSKTEMVVLTRKKSFGGDFQV